MQQQSAKIHKPQYIPLIVSIRFLMSKGRLVGWSLLLFVATILCTWIGYQLAVNLVDQLTSGFFNTPPDTATILGWLQHKGWLITKWLYLFISRVISFYLAFLLAYTITSPGYVFLSTSAERLQAGEKFEEDDAFTVRVVIRDLFEGLKIAAFGLIVTIGALAANFIPLVGQAVAFLLITYYSALMFLDYPASRRHWSLGRKIGWLNTYRAHCFRLGLLPALVSMIPIVNIFLIAILFPFLTVHATLNFTSLELGNTKTPARKN